MSRRHQLGIGSILVIGGLAVIAVGAVFPSRDPMVALGWLLVTPLLVALCGAVFVCVGLARISGAARRSAVAYRIVGLVAIAGLGVGLGYPAAGIVSQIPDTAAGLNGPFVPGSAPGLGAFVCSGVGLSAGLVIGVLTAVLWWSSRGHRPPPETIARP
jgi:hypothetical protein